MVTERIIFMLEQCWGNDNHFPKTDLFNEGWMLRLTLDWFRQQEKDPSGSPLPTGYQWYSESRLPSPFLPRYRGDKQAESHTHADGVVGDFIVGRDSVSELALQDNAEVLVVIEAKMFSGLSRRTTNAPDYDQAARTVACIAEVLARQSQNPSEMKRLSFFVIAPQEQIDRQAFEELVSKDSIRKKVESRLSNYDEPMDGWKDEWFMPVLEATDIDVLPWESILHGIQARDATGHEELAKFYAECITHNRPSR